MESLEFRTVESLPEFAQTRTHRSYHRLMTAVMAAAGVWIEVDVTQVSGATSTLRSHSLYQAARARGMSVSVATGEGKMYVRLTEPDLTGLPVVRPLTEAEVRDLARVLLVGMGEHQIICVYRGRRCTFDKCVAAVIPAEFLTVPAAAEQA